MLDRLPLVEQSNQEKVRQKVEEVAKWVHTVTENNPSYRIGVKSNAI